MIRLVAGTCQLSTNQIAGHVSCTCIIQERVRSHAARDCTFEKRVCVTGCAPPMDAKGAHQAPACLRQFAAPSSSALTQRANYAAAIYTHCRATPCHVISNASETGVSWPGNHAGRCPFSAAADSAAADLPALHAPRACKQPTPAPTPAISGEPEQITSPPYRR